MSRPKRTSLDERIREVISKNLSNILRSRDITQVKLADITGIKKSTINGYVKGTSTPTPGNSQKIADALKISKDKIDPRFSDDTAKIIEKESSNDVLIPLFGNIAAGSLDAVDRITEDNVQYIKYPKSFLGKYQSSKDLFAMKVNGESINKVIPNKSYVILKPVDLDQIKQDDLIVFSHGDEYSLKRFRRDDEDKVLILRPESTDHKFRDIIIKYDTSNDLKIYGKVICYSVALG